MDKGKAKMPEYEDDRFDNNELTHSLDCEFDGFDMPFEETWSEERYCHNKQKTSTLHLKNYDDYMAYHCVFMMKVAAV